MATLLALWKLDETGLTTVRVDATGRGNDWTNSNAEWASGVCSGNAIYYHPGTAQALDRASTTDLQLGSFDWEITGWMKRPSGGSSAGMVALMKASHSAPSDPDYMVWMDNLYAINLSVRNAANSASQTVTSASVGVGDVWQFFDVYYDHTNSLLGATIGTNVFTTAAWSGGVFVGSGDARTNNGNGAISTVGGFYNSNIAVWSGLLTPSERSFLSGGATSGCPPPYPFSGNIAWELYLERVQSGNDLSTQAYGSPTYFIFSNPVVNVEYSQEKNVFDTDGLVAGDPAYLKVRRLGGDANNTDSRTQTLVSVDLSIPVKAS